MDDQWAMAGKFGLVLLVVLTITGGAVITFSSGSIIPGEDTDQQDPEPDSNGDIEWNEYKDIVGMKLPTQVSSESVVFIPENVSPENYDSADVATIGADQNEDDTTELFASADAEEGEDYYQFSTFNSKITSDLPDSGTYKVAVIGTGVGNTYYDSVEIPEMVDQLRAEQDAPIQPLNNMDKDVLQYAGDSDVTATNTLVMDGDSTIALSNDFSSKSDSDVDGSVTLQKEYEVADERVVQFGEMSVSSVNGNVSEVEFTVMVDGEEVESVTETDFSDNEGLDDSVEFGVERATESVTVEGYVEFDDPEVTTATDLVTFELDDTDADGDSDDGSYGITALTSTLTGY
jgi:hypothetical protein